MKTKVKKYKPRKVRTKIEIIEFKTCEKKCIRTNINKKEYEICDNLIMWVNKKRGSRWNNGLINNSGDPRRCERIGKIGEFGFAKIFGLSVDLEYKTRGDDYDFVFNDLTIDVKTSQKKPWYESGLVKAIDNRGTLVLLRSDIYVFGYLDVENKKKKKATVVLVGFKRREDIIKYDRVPAILGEHKNYQIPYEDLEDINKLFVLKR